jgi:formylglycine-generating enzyme required for sulfatase activity
VGSYEKGISPYGAYDMAGNALEWVADWYDDGYYASSPEANPTGPQSGDFRVLRGGSWSVSDGIVVFSVRSAGRLLSNPTFTNFDVVGFRCSRSAASP